MEEDKTLENLTIINVHFDFGRPKIILLAEKFCAVKSFLHDTSHVAIGVDRAIQIRFTVGRVAK